VSDVALLLVDEVHLLAEDRGPTLEAGVVCRLRALGRLPAMAGTSLAALRVLAVSATVPNAVDIATWLEVPPGGCRTYGEEMRPVKIQTHVKGFPPAANDFMFERRLNERVFAIVQERWGEKPVLAFCSSRKGAAADACCVSVALLRCPGPRISAASGCAWVQFLGRWMHRWMLVDLTSKPVACRHRRVREPGPRRLEPRRPPRPVVLRPQRGAARRARSGGAGGARQGTEGDAGARHRLAPRSDGAGGPRGGGAAFHGAPRDVPRGHGHARAGARPQPGLAHVQAAVCTNLEPPRRRCACLCFRHAKAL
jgi:hypothetical protein